MVDKKSATSTGGRSGHSRIPVSLSNATGDESTDDGRDTVKSEVEHKSRRPSKRLEHSEDSAQSVGNVKQKPNKKKVGPKKLNPLQRIFGDDLAEVEEDVVPREKLSELTQECRNVPSFEFSPTPEEEINHIHKMYIQTTRGYKAVDHDSLNFSSKDSGLSKNEVDSKEAANQIQMLWFRFSTICHGFLGGISLGHLILVWTTDPNELEFDNLTKYDTFADVFGNTFYFMSIICMVSIFDRMDLVSFRFRKRRSILWITLLVIYSITICMALSSDTIDERLYYIVGTNITVTEDDIKLNKVLNIYNRLSIGRSTGGLLGWFLLGMLCPNEVNCK